MSEPHQTSVGSRERERPARHLDLPCRVGRAHSEQEAAERLIRFCRWESVQLGGWRTSQDS
jgi:hypothetical protein